MPEKEDLIDVNKMTQRELILHTFREVQSLKISISESNNHNRTRIDNLEDRVRVLEDKNATDKGVRLGLGLAATIISLAALGLSFITVLRGG